MKIAVSKVAEILKKNHLEPGILRRVIEEMNLVLSDQQQEVPEKAEKKQLTVLVSDPDKLIKHDLVAWVLAIPESTSPAVTEDLLLRAIGTYNTSKKGRMYPARTLGSGLEDVPAKYFKEEGVVVKTKVPLLLVPTQTVKIEP